ncbi:hypothetical protein CC78DRAFT_481611, partial [Lojkania enalia]
VLPSLSNFVILILGAMLAPALSNVSEELRISKDAAAMALRIFILAFSFGPMILASCFDVKGRRPVWIIGKVWCVL